MILNLLFSLIYSAPVHLTDENYTDFISSTNHSIFLKLWANWCPHCKELEPIWNELAEISEYDGVVSIADVECEANKKICKQFDVENYPRLYWIGPLNKSALAYHGSRTLSHFKMFIKKQLNFPLIPINDTSDLEKYTKTANIATVVFFKINDKDTQSLSIAKDVASHFQSSEVRFIHYGDDTIKSPEMICYNQVNRNESFSGDWNKEQLTNFIYLRATPFLVEMDSYAMEFFMKYNISTFIRVSNVSRRILPYSFDTCEKVSKLFPVTKTNCRSYPWFCRLVDINLNISDDHFVIYNGHMKYFWIYRGESKDPEVIYNWAKNVSLNLVKYEGPGNGLFSPFKAMYYAHKSQGHPAALIFIPPICVLLIGILVTYNICKERKSLKKKNEKKNEKKKK